MTIKNTNEKIKERPPVIAIMGHIDHGKSTLLDYIRKSNITEKEVGGITQKISAYEVVDNGKKITFLDTPGHEAFTKLRSRGSKVADLAILVVAADDGVKPQTLDALKSINESKLPYIVAINKMDKEGANLERTKQNLAENEIYIEGYGGNISFVPISAKTGLGIPELFELIHLATELEGLTGDESIPGEGIVIEANRDKEKGISATLIIKNGTLKTGMYVVAGESISPVRIFQNFLGESIQSATFSAPVRVIGFNVIPDVGLAFKSYESKKEAEEAALKNKGAQGKNIQEETTPADNFQIPLIIKADTSGMLEAIEYEISKIKNDRITLKVVSSGIGDISENDVKQGSGSEHTIIIGFNTKISSAARNLAERLSVELKTFDIIYKLTEWLEYEVVERAPKMEVEEKTGQAKVLKVFSKVKDRQVIGCRVEEGIISINEELKITRRDAEIGQGRIRELQKQKTKASEVEAGSEFGTMIESKIEIAPGDKIETFKIVKK